MPAHLVNDPFAAVDDMLSGILAANRERIALTPCGRGVYTLAPNPARRVAVIVGGGSGHEPAFLGWVGPGFADGAAVGNIFASPSADPAVELVQVLARPDGALFLFGNYEGDVMNFGLASALLADEGTDTRTVLLTDDVASAPPSQAHKRRGVAGGVVVTKIVGALADLGASLDDVEAMARQVNARTRTVGVALSSCHLPTAAKPTFDLPAGEIDFGIGVHGEAGLSRRPLADANATADELVDLVLGDITPVSGAGTAVVVVNAFGATPLLESFIVLSRAQRRISDAGIRVAFAHSGSYLTSLQMAGVSLTVSLLDPAMETLLAAPATPLYLPALGGSR
jgi:dihydroxyacetone kinase-like protein